MNNLLIFIRCVYKDTKFHEKRPTEVSLFGQLGEKVGQLSRLIIIDCPDFSIVYAYHINNTTRISIESHCWGLDL